MSISHKPEGSLPMAKRSAVSVPTALTTQLPNFPTPKLKIKWNLHINRLLLNLKDRKSVV